MKNILQLTIFFLGFSCFGQVTQIPDSNFEQALIQRGIDSDNTVNGQVLTSDVNTVKNLNISWLGITDITGIEDFSMLEVLDISSNFLEGNNGLLDLSFLKNLKELYMNDGGDGGSMNIEYLTLNNNPNLQKIHIKDNWFFKTLDITGSDLSLTNLEIDFLHETEPVCISVTNPTDAQNGQEVYATWTVTGNNYSFSNNCSLSTITNKKENLVVFPNPTTENFQIQTQHKLLHLSHHLLY